MMGLDGMRDVLGVELGCKSRDGMQGRGHEASCPYK